LTARKKAEHGDACLALLARVARETLCFFLLCFLSQRQIARCARDDRRLIVAARNRADSDGISDRSRWTDNPSDGNSGVAFGIGIVFPEKSVQATGNSGVDQLRCWKPREIASRFTQHSCRSLWIPEISTRFPILADGISQKSGGNRGLQTNTAASLTGFFRESPDTRKNPGGSPRNPSYGLAICTDSLRFQQEISPFRRTRRKIRREFSEKKRESPAPGPQTIDDPSGIPLSEESPPIVLRIAVGRRVG
jgi:hypothetical protein